MKGALLPPWLHLLARDLGLVLEPGLLPARLLLPMREAHRVAMPARNPRLKA